MALDYDSNQNVVIRISKTKMRLLAQGLADLRKAEREGKARFIEALEGGSVDDQKQAEARWRARYARLSGFWDVLQALGLSESLHYRALVEEVQHD